jgi:hypothetical protein
MSVLQVVPHAAGVESLFSDMGATKTKRRSRMKTITLKMSSQVRMHLLSEDSNKKYTSQNKKQASKSDIDTEEALAEHDLGLEELEYFEEGVFAHLDPIDPSLYVDETGFITSIFDFRVFEKSCSSSLAQESHVIDVPDSPGVAWSADDLFK